MEKSVKDRLIEYLKYKRISKSDFGRSIGVSSAYISSMRRSISQEKKEIIEQIYTDLNIEWLLYGIGSMLKNIKAEPSLLDILKEFDNFKKTQEELKEMIRNQNNLIKQQQQALSLLEHQKSNNNNIYTSDVKQNSIIKK